MKQIEGRIGYQLVQLMRAHRNRAESLLCRIGLHTGQEMILFLLSEEQGLTHTQLSQGLCVEPPTVSKALQRMEAAGLVERRPDANDARVSRVYLTEAGEALVGPALEAWNCLEEQTTHGLTDAEQVLLRRLLIQMRGNLQ